MRALAIDLGTSGIKTAVVDVTGAIVATGFAPVHTERPETHGAEQDPEQVWSATLDACRQALAGAGARDRIVSIGVCSQFSSVIPMAAPDRAAMNMVLWMDQRGTPARIAALPGGERDTLWRKLRWLRIHGAPPIDSGFDSASHMRFVKHLRPEVYERTWKFVEPMDYLTLRFTGRATTNPCSAFSMMVVDNRRHRLDAPRYDDTLVRWSGIEPDKLPELVPVGSQVGVVLPKVAEQLGLSNRVAVWTAINDNQAGSMGAAAFRGTHAGLSFGTTSNMVTHVPFKRTDIRRGLASMPSPVPGTYFVLAENGLGGRAVEFFLEKLVFATDRFADHSIEEKFDALHAAIADVPAGSGGVLFMPWLTGVVTPVEDGRVRGGFLNITTATTREHLGRAVLEGVAFNSRWVRQAVESFSKRSMSHVFFYGGGAVSDLWAQILADVNQLPVHQAAEPAHTVCRGVGLTSLHWHGALGLDDFVDRIPLGKVFEPQAENAALYDHMYGVFVEAFGRNRRIFNSLNN
jgi:xylulokinase